MSNFSAEIQAKLNTDGIINDIKNIGKSKIRFENISIDTSNFVSKIQSALNSHKFTINLSDINTSNISGQMQKAGSSAGKIFSDSFNNNILTKNFETSLKKATSALKSDGLELSISKVTAQYERLGNTGNSKLEEIKKNIRELSKLQENMRNSTNNFDLVSNYEKFNETLKKVKNNLDIVSAENKIFVNSSQIASFDKEIEQWMKNNTKATKEFGSALDSIRNRLKSLDSSGEATASVFNSLKEEFKEIKQSAAIAGKTGNSLASQFQGAFTSITKYVSASTVIYQAINGLKQMYQNIYNIDTAMTELKKVTNETDESYSKFLKDAGNTAQEIGTTISDYITSTTDFARLGYSFTDSQDLAKVANIYSVVGDEIDSIDTATKSIISTITAFSSEMDSSMSQGDFALSIIDKFNEVGNNYAISSGGIGEALERSASSMAAANNTLDETIALITAANTVVQDPDSIGTAFKTISMRIRGAKTEMEEAGLETDGMAKSVSELRDEIKALSGVDIMVDDDTFKSTYDILDELSQKWEDLTDIQQASITELIAGKRQGNIVSSLMTNFDIARDTLKTSLNSEGSATEELGKWMEGLEAKSKQFRAAFESLSQTFLDSSFFKGLIDAGTGVLKILTAIIDKVGALPTLIGTISAALSFKNVGKDKMFSFFLS